MIINQSVNNCLFIDQSNSSFVSNNCTYRILTIHSYPFNNLYAKKRVHFLSNIRKFECGTQINTMRQLYLNLIDRFGT